ncbi:hypothetical protein [Arthrobacter sp. D2-10]
MTEAFSLVIVLCFMGALYYFMLRGATNKESSAARTLQLLGNKHEKIPEFFSGVLVALCFLEIGAVRDEVSALILGAGTAILSAVCAFAWGALRLVIHAFYGFVGLVGTAYAIGRFAGQVHDDWGRFLALLLVLIFFAWGAAIAFAAGRLQVKSALGLFGSVQLLIFLASPLATQILTDQGALLLSLIGGVIMGLVSGMNSVWVEISASIVISFESFMVFSGAFVDSSGTLISVAESNARILILLGFFVPFVLIRLVGTRLRANVIR